MRVFHIAYFTGTGNTARAAEILAEELRSQGHSAELTRVRGGAADKAGEARVFPDADVLVVLFPVYSLAPPRPILSFVRKLPPVRGKEAVVMENHGMVSMKGGLHTGYGGGSADMVAAILRRKGYLISGTAGVGYPENVTIIAHALSPRNAAEVIEAGDATIRRFAREVSTGTARVIRHAAPARVLSHIGSLLSNYLGSWQFSKLYVADARCTSCGLCAKACPASAISMAGGRPRWRMGCDFCLCCYNACPVRAVQISLPRVIFFIVATVLPIILLVRSFITIKSLIDVVLGLSAWAPQPVYAIITVLWVVVLYSVLYMLIFLAFDLLAALAEKTPTLRRIVGWTYTRGLRRYLSPGYKPFASTPRVGYRTDRQAALTGRSTDRP